MFWFNKCLMFFSILKFKYLIISFLIFIKVEHFLNFRFYFLSDESFFKRKFDVYFYSKSNQKSPNLNFGC